MLLACFMALEVLGADIASDMASTPQLVLVICHERVEGEIASCAGGWFLLKTGSLGRAAKVGHVGGVIENKRMATKTLEIRV